MLQSSKVFNWCAALDQKEHHPPQQLRSCTFFINTLVELGKGDYNKILLLEIGNHQSPFVLICLPKKPFLLQKTTNSTTQVKLNTKQTSVRKDRNDWMNRDRNIHHSSVFNIMSRISSHTG